MSTAKTENEQVARLRELIKGIRVAMLTTISEDRSLHSRPLATREMDFEGDLWFFTAKSSHKVSELEQDNRVNVSYANPDDNRYVSVSGRAELVDDPKRAEEYWSSAYRIWFPKGLDDPDLTLLKVNVEHAQFWDNPAGKMVTLYGIAKAMVTGKPSKEQDTNVIHI